MTHIIQTPPTSPELNYPIKVTGILVNVGDKILANQTVICTVMGADGAEIAIRDNRSGVVVQSFAQVGQIFMGPADLFEVEVEATPSVIARATAARPSATTKVEKPAKQTSKSLGSSPKSMWWKLETYIVIVAGLMAAAWFFREPEPQNNTPTTSTQTDTNTASRTVDDSYSATICNESGAKVYVAYVWRVRPSDEHRTLSGWRTIENGACSTLFDGDFGGFSNDYFYYRVEDDDRGFWDGNGISGFCVANTRMERLLDDEDYTCRGDEEYKSFGEVEIKTDRPHYTLTLD